jgi:hypothetical protein
MNALTVRLVALPERRTADRPATDIAARGRWQIPDWAKRAGISLAGFLRGGLLELLRGHQGLDQPHDGAAIALGEVGGAKTCSRAASRGRAWRGGGFSPRSSSLVTSRTFASSTSTDGDQRRDGSLSGIRPLSRKSCGPSRPRSYVAKLPIEEPDGVVPHVRICGSPGRETARGHPSAVAAEARGRWAEGASGAGSELGRDGGVIVAVSQDGRIVLDDPGVDLPEGTEVEVVLVDYAKHEMDAEERAALGAEIEAGCDEADQDLGEDADTVLARMEALVQSRLTKTA